MARAYDEDDSAILTLGFSIEGILRTQNDGFQDDFYEQGGESCLFFLPGTREIEEEAAGRHVGVRIWVRPQLLRTFGQGQAEILPQELQPFLESNSAPIFHRAAGRTSPAMRLALQQLLNCPLQRMHKRMYLEAKVLELIVLQFAQLVNSPPNVRRSVKLKPDDRDRIYQARDILIRNLAHSRSVIDLAQQVGVNEFKLRQGFHEKIFGNTVFGCLRDTQMQEVQRLLLERNTTVAGVAARIGYASRTAFNAVFRKKFGMSPKEYQMADRIR